MDELKKVNRSEYLSDTEDVWLCKRSHGFKLFVCTKGSLNWYPLYFVMNVHFFGLKSVFSSYSALIAAFEKTKKKYQGKLKKLEFQIQALTERYEAQVMGVKEGQLQLLSL